MNTIVINSPKDNVLIYNDIVTIDYVLQNPDLNFYAINFYLNDTLIKTVKSFKGNFSVVAPNGINTIKAHCVNKDLKKLPNTEIFISFENAASDIQKAEENNKLIQYQLPEFIKEDYSNFVDFIKEYYKFLEKSNDPNLVPFNLENYRDLDTVPEYILDKIKQELMQDFDLDISKNIETGYSANYRNLIKNIKEFYDSKGTENALRFLFRVLFDKEIEVYYPKLDILRLSDGKWSEKYFLEIKAFSDKYAAQFLNGSIFELNTSGVKISEAKIRSIVTKVDTTRTLIAILELDEISGTFSGSNLYIKVPVNGVETVFTVTKNAPIIIQRGYINEDGHVSAKKYIHDNDYYQDYSYDVQSDVSPDKFYETVRRVTHTAGTKMFTSGLLSKKTNSVYNNVGAEVEYNGSIIVAHFMGYSPNSKQDLNELTQQGGGTYDAYPDGYLFGEDGTDLYIPAGSTKTLTAQQTSAFDYASVTTLYSVSAAGISPVPEEEAPPGVLETTDGNNLITHEYTRSAPINFDLINYLPADKLEFYREYWIPAKHFKAFAKRDGILRDTDIELSIGEFTIQEILDSQKDISNIYIAQTDEIQETNVLQNTLNQTCYGNCDRLYNTTKCFQTHLGQYEIYTTDKPSESDENYEYKLQRWKAYQNCMNPNRICKQNCEQNYPSGNEYDLPVNIDE